MFTIMMFLMLSQSQTPTPETKDTSEPPLAEKSATVENTAFTNAGYHDGFFVKDEKGPFELKIKGRLQLRHTWSIFENARDHASFALARGRMVLSGYAFDKNLRYYFQPEFGGGLVYLRDYYTDYTFSEMLAIRVGQFKRPFSRQQINSSGKLQLVDRTIADSYFNAGRDIGVALHNGYENSPTFEYAVGVFNSTGDKPSFSGNVTIDPTTNQGTVSGGKFSNVPETYNPAVVARVGYNSDKLKGYSEVDFEGGDLRYGVAASVVTDLDADNQNNATTRAELDTIIKCHGFSFLGSLYLGANQNDEKFYDQKLQSTGYHVEAGYLLTEHLQPVLRYVQIAPKGVDNDLQELTGGFNVYFYKHNLAWQTDASMLRTEKMIDNSTTYRVRSQLQLAF